MSGHQLGGPINSVMQPGIPPQQQGPPQQQHMNQINSPQLGANAMSQAQLNHMQRKVNCLPNFV